ESIQPKAEVIKTVVGKGELINVRSTYIPIVRLYEVFASEPQYTDPKEAILLILETEGERVAVMVDEILGQQQVVIKSIEQNFHKVEGIAGNTHDPWRREGWVHYRCTRRARNRSSRQSGCGVVIFLIPPPC